MVAKDDLITSIAATTADYRQADGEIASPERVALWIENFDRPVQTPILQEMDHVLKKTYFSRYRTEKFLAGLFRTKKLVGDDPCDFWRGAQLLEIQSVGASQREMNALFRRILKDKCGFSINRDESSSDTFIYLDDAIFSGARVSSDIITWINENAPDKANIHVIVIAIHQNSYFYRNKIMECIKSSKKSIKIHWWKLVAFEDRKVNTDISDVLRPVEIPDDDLVKAYVETMRYPPHLRKAGHVGNEGVFSSDAGRQLLETEFLKAGVRIREMCPNLNSYQRPLGNMVLETLGFGSLVVTFRNCPNNAPLALWAGAPWQPLFPRATNSTSR